MMLAADYMLVFGLALAGGIVALITAIILSGNDLDPDDVERDWAE